MDLFYLKHSWLAFKRDPSAGQYGLIAMISFFLVIAINSGLYFELDNYRLMAKSWLGIANPAKFLWVAFTVFWLIDLLTKIALPATIPKTRPYLLWEVKRRDWAFSFLLISATKFWNLLILLFQIPFFIKFSQWSLAFPSPVLAFLPIMIAFAWLTNHYLAIAVNLVSNKVKVIAILVVVLIAFLLSQFGGHLLVSFLENVWSIPVIVIGLALAVTFAYYNTLHYLKRSRTEEKKENSFGQSFYFSISKNPLIQLEWALITRNKRAYTNFLAGLLVIPYFFYVMPMSNKSELNFAFLLIGIVCTGFTLVQHGVYTLAWEGSFFDLLMTRVSIRDFLKHKYNFFLYTSLIALAICMIFLINQPVRLLVIIGAFLFNIGWNLPVILNNSLKNTTKLDLGKGTFFNYQGLNGTLFLTSMLVMIVPVILFTILTLSLGELYGIIAFAILGLTGLLLRDFFIQKITKKFEKRKYHLSHCYRN